MRQAGTSTSWDAGIGDADLATCDPSFDDLPAARDNHTLIYEDDAIRVVSVRIAPGSIEKSDHHQLPSVFVVGYYEVLSAACLEGISAACLHDPNVTTLRENAADVALGWPDALESWKDMPFASLAERSSPSSTRKLAIKVHTSIAHVAGVAQGRGKMKNANSFAFSALEINTHEARGDKWLIVHHHSSKASLF